MLLKKILFVVAAMALLSSAALAQTAPVVSDIPEPDYRRRCNFCNYQPR